MPQFRVRVPPEQERTTAPMYAAYDKDIGMWLLTTIPGWENRYENESAARSDIAMAPHRIRFTGVIEECQP